MFYFIDVKRQTEQDVILKGTIFNSEGDVVQRIFDDGVSLKENVLGPFTIIINEENTYKGKLTDKLSGSAKAAGFILMINNKVKQVLNNLGIKNIEYYPIEIKGRDLNSKDYMVANILGKIDCIDDANSLINYDEEGYVEDVEKLVLDETKLPKDLKVFIIDKFIPARYLIDQGVKDEIEASGITGFTFISVDQYTK